MEPKRGIFVTIVRWIVGATFIFSGLTKCVDPVGVSIYVDKYLATYSLEAMMPLSEGMAVALSTLELLLGVVLVTGQFRRIASILSLIIISLFTAITLLSATILPIGECGCFGDILYLTPWQTFIKNVIILLLTLVLCRYYRERDSITLRGIIVVVLGVAIPLATNLYALRHLPIVDSMPYKVNTALYDEVSRERENEKSAVQNVLIFKNLSTGENVEFDASDSACWDDANLEFVDATTRMMPMDDTYGEFRLYNAEGEDCSLDILSRKGRVALLCINDIDGISDRDIDGMNILFESYPPQGIVVLTSVNGEDVEGMVDIEGVEVYTIDAMTLRSVIRAEVGVVVLYNGVVEYKADIRDI